MKKEDLTPAIMRLALKYGAAALREEAELVEEEGSWLHMSLLFLMPDDLRRMADYAEMQGRL